MNFSTKPPAKDSTSGSGKTTSASKERIQLACKALEEALNNFEQDNSEEENRRQAQLKELKSRLEAIRSQLDDLSQ